MRGNLPPRSPGILRRTLAICSGSQGENRQTTASTDQEKWKRLGSGKPQQSAAATRDESLHERYWRQAAVDRSSCSRLTSRRSPVRAGHRPYSRATLRCGTAASTPDHRCLSRKAALSDRPLRHCRFAMGSSSDGAHRPSCAFRPTQVRVPSSAETPPSLRERHSRRRSPRVQPAWEGGISSVRLGGHE